MQVTGSQNKYGQINAYTNIRLENEGVSVYKEYTFLGINFTSAGTNNRKIDLRTL